MISSLKSKLTWLALLSTISLLFACDGTESTTPVTTSRNLTLVGSFPLSIEEPSGLSLAKDGESLWTVSDADGKVYEIDLQGKLLGSFQTQYKDLEAVASMDAETLAFIAEGTREIVVVATKDGKTIRSAKINMPGSKNKGPEALTFDESKQEFHLMQENSGLLVTLDANLQEDLRRELTFAEDYSSISFESQHQQFWVLSDRSKSIHVLDQDLQMQTSFSTNIQQMEGLAVDHEKRLLYIVSDPLARLYVFRFEESKTEPSTAPPPLAL